MLLQNVPLDTPKQEFENNTTEGMECQIELTGSRRTRLWCPIVEAMQMWLEGTWFWICILASRSRANLTLPPKIMGHAQVAWQLDSLLPPRITYSAKNASPPTDWQA